MVERHLGATTEILFNGIEVARYAPDPGHPAVRRAAGRPAVFFLARHEARKGLAVFVEAARHLPRDIELWVGGVGPETARLMAATADDDRFCWLGELHESEKSDRLSRADVFCAPSLGGESFGVVLLEAMAAETPVVASDLEAYQLTSRGGRDAQLFETGDAAALAKAILRSIELGPDIVRRIESGRERAAEFSMDRLAACYIERYERLVPRRR